MLHFGSIMLNSADNNAISLCAPCRAPADSQRVNKARTVHTSAVCWSVRSKPLAIRTSEAEFRRSIPLTIGAARSWPT